MEPSGVQKVAVACADRAFLDQLQQQFTDHMEWGVQIALVAGDAETFLNNLHRVPAEAFLLDVDVPGGVEVLCHQLHQAGCREFVFTARDPGSSSAQRVLPWGEVVRKDAPALSFTLALLRTRVTAPSRPTSPGGQAPATVVVHGPKGGSGKSLVAISLALQYAAAGKRALLVDLAQYGSVGPLLGLRTHGSGLGKVADELGRDPTLALRDEFAGLVLGSVSQAPVDTRTLDVLVAAPPLKMARLGLHEAAAGFQVLKAAGYDVLITDTSAEVSERLGVALKQSDWVLLVSGTEVTDAWALAQMQDLLRNLTRPEAPGKVVLALNRCSPKTNTQEFADLMGYPVAATIPVVERPLEQIAPFQFSARKSPFARSLRGLAQRFVPIYPENMLSRWLKGAASKG